MRTLLLAIALIIGSIVGAGILAMPYAIAQSGFLLGLIEILILGFVMTILYLYLGEVTLRLPGKHELTGYAEKFLGKYGKFGFAFAMVFGIYGALIAYLLGIGESASNLLGGSKLIYSLIAFVILGYLIYKGLKLIKNIEFWMIGGVLTIILFIAIFSFTNIDYNNYKEISFTNVFVPYGTILFAFLGASVIPEVRQVINSNKKLMKKSIIITMVFITFVYILFSFTVVGVTGKATTEVATTGLGDKLGSIVYPLGNLFAIFAMSTSFLALGLALRWMFEYDYKLNKWLTLFLVLIIPLMFILLHIGSFALIISIAGVVAGGVEGILTVLMHHKAKRHGTRKPEYTIHGSLLVYMLISLLFIVGIVLTLKNYF